MVRTPAVLERLNAGDLRRTWALNAVPYRFAGVCRASGRFGDIKDLPEPRFGTPDRPKSEMRTNRQYVAGLDLGRFSARLAQAVSNPEFGRFIQDRVGQTLAIDAYSGTENTVQSGSIRWL
jgi:hypothetical protein